MTELVFAGNVYYLQDFDESVVNLGVASPIWSLPVGVGEKIGRNNLFDVVSDVSHSGQYSLRFNYDGRNGICNMCGGKTRVQKSNYDNTNFFIDSLGGDLTADPIFAAAGRFIYNTTSGFSKWRILSIDNQDAVNDKLSLELTKNSIDNSSNNFSTGDNVNIYRQCGVDGSVGGNVVRRSDCNVAINYLNLSGASQVAGQSLYRRVYLRVTADAVLPNDQKFRYWVTETGPVWLQSRVDSSGNVFLWVGAVSVGGPAFTRPDITLDRDTWYYIEEEFKARSSSSANDGEYRLWVSKSGDENNVPLIELTGLALGIVTRTSLWGNHQHNGDSHGFWYIDDFAISNSRLGPINGQPRPSSPSSINIR